ncbi:amidohydrolase [Aliikangiella marina]|uniref:Amidohydrolase n=1 Tax=Aliikangiella marina TaxID=1712262 RepID=A0A545T2N4_9GAMM|nr:amidohydrolase [Aliikangiella marina]TQV71483.1 amidohydrolase [Aliikangiella marina]
MRLKTLLLALVSINLLPLNLLAAADLSEQINKDYHYLDKLYKHLHQTPEISFQEKETAKKIGDELEKLGFDVTRDFGGHGVVGVYQNGDGPTIMIRTDLDALPVRETTGLDYASKKTMKDREGKTTFTMHACGHDIHMTVFTGTARRLIDNKQNWSGTLVMIGQPAEERSGGAKAMLAEGLFEKFPRPDYNLAIHVSADLEAGTIGAVSGFAMANVDSVDIIVKGEGGHGAYPHNTKDPIVLSAQIINSLQTIVSRETSPLEPAVVTVGSIHGGSQHNIISNEVKMQLTLRSYSTEVRKNIISAIRRMTKNLALAAGLPENKIPEVNVLDESTPAAYNNPKLTENVVQRFIELFGENKIFTLKPEMVGEDFGRYGQVEPKIPSLMFRLGTVESSKFERAKTGTERLPTLHSSDFAPDPEPTIKTGVKAMASAALLLLNKQ